MAALELWLPLIGGGIFVAIAIGAWFADHKITAVWSGFFGAVALLLLIALQIQENVREVVKEPTVKIESPDRPWVAFELGIAGPLAYDTKVNKSGGWHIPLTHRLRNSGNSPAFNVESVVSLKPFFLSIYPKDTVFKDHIPQGPPLPGTDVAEELKKLCDGFAGWPEQFRGGRTLFKEQAWQGITDVAGDPIPFETAKGMQNYSGMLLLMYCVTYHSGPERRVHQTGEAFLLFKQDGKIDLAGEVVQASELGLTSAPMGGSIAN